MRTKEVFKAKYDVELIVKNRAHLYRVVSDGQEYIFPGCTGILSIIGGDKTNMLMNWAKKESLNSVRRELMAIGASPIIMEPHVVDGIISRAGKKPKEALDKAADIGTRLHDAVDCWIKGLPIKLDDDLQNPFLAFKDWVTSCGIAIIMGDTAVASIDYGFGGKFDAIGMREGKLGILDWKTSNGLYDSYALQLAAYSRAAEETYGKRFEWGMAVRFDKNAQFSEYKEVKDLGLAFNTFVYAKNLQESLKETHWK